LICRANAT